MSTQIEIVDGPLKGTCHELEFGWPAPAKLRLPDPALEYLGVHHWHEVRDGKAYYINSITEPKGQPHA